MSTTTGHSKTTRKHALSAEKKTVSRRRSSKGRLRKHATLDGSVIVEEPIIFNVPKSNDDNNNNNNNNNNNKDTIGEGCYISCTVHRTRYYGVLVDQNTLTAATDLYLRNEADSLDLNRRMKHFHQLQQHQQQQQYQQQHGGLKRPRDFINDDITTTATTATRKQPQQQVHHQRLNSSQMVQIQNLMELQNAQRAELHKLHQTNLASYGNKVQNNSSITMADRSHLEQLCELEELQRKERDEQDELFLEQSKAIWETFRHSSDSTRTFSQVEPPDSTIPNSDVVENSDTAMAGVVNEAQVGTDKDNTYKCNSQPSSNDHNFNNYDIHDKMQDIRQVQKFLFIPPNYKTDPGYRTLLATYANVNAAAEDNPEKVKLISKACNDGGNFVGKYYYQYMKSDNNIIVGTQSIENEHDTQKRSDIRIHTSLNVAAFFQSTTLPSWFPLSNIGGFRQNKVLSILKLKKTKESGEVEFDGDSGDLLIPNPTVEFDTKKNNESISVTAETNVYRVGILGGGIAGLACAAELLRLAELEKHTKDEIKHLQVVLLEGRDRIGGRLHTDYDSLDCAVDLGAGWIHGIDGNPITDLAKESGLTLVPTAEDVKLISGNMQLIHHETDKRISSLFDKLLDEAMDQCWEHNELQEIDTNTRQQCAIRWYGSALTGKRCGKDKKPCFPEATDVPIHRHSTDISIDHALGLVTCSSLTEEELRLLHWHTKNVEYALGADISSLSMKFLSAEEDNAFEGRHVMLREGYSKISEFLLERCLRRKKNFSLILKFPIGTVEYSRKKLRNTLEAPRSESLEETKCCRITSQDGKSSYDFDFLVCTLPLGVLKHSIAISKSSANQSAIGSPACGTSPDEDPSKTVFFKPELPLRKRDAIEAVGFGILNKIYLQFPFAFWRQKGCKDSLKDTPLFSEEQQTFGNVSGVNPHIYMFYDIGMIMSNVQHRENSLESPAILLSLVSGCEAVRLEQLSEEEVVQEVMVTLNSIFTNVKVPQPTRVKLTMWGSDEFSRGCYSFLPPGATNEDHAILQLPLNGNGDKYSDQNYDTMRLFWAGEHTSSLHPSMAHGALLSGIRAAEEVINEMEWQGKDRVEMFHNDTPVPVTIYRSRYPLQPLACQLCHKTGSRKEEGALISFQRGVKAALVHLQCILYSPEVECVEDRWKNVFKAISRGKQIKCSKCRTLGATIGCNVSSCPHSYHFSCCEQEGWSFEHDGKGFLCKNHRDSLSNGNGNCSEIGALHENGANSSRFQQNTIQHDLFTSSLQKSHT